MGHFRHSSSHFSHNTNLSTHTLPSTTPERLRAMDLKDFKERRAPLGKSALGMRVRKMLVTKKTKQVAKKMVLSLRKTCALVLKKKGAASGK